ncbi:MAG: DUF7305 domain-containing protein, partial [Planctomycetota bacterium]
MAVPLMLCAAVTASDPNLIFLTGTVRDFHATHPDFDVVPLGGYGHFADNLQPSLVSTVPVIKAAPGYRVDTQWRDSSSRPIPPHLASVTSGGGSTVPVVSGPSFDNAGYADTFDSSVGPYGGANVGPAPSFAMGSSMPSVTAPAGMPSRVDSVEFSGGSHTLDSDVYCKDFIIKDGATLNVTADVRILSDEKFTLQNAAKLRLIGGATLSVWVRKVCTFQDGVEANVNTADPSRFQIFNLGTDAIIVQNGAQVYASAVSPGRELHIQDFGDFYGTFAGASMHVQNDAGFHLDTRINGVEVCGAMINDTLGAAGSLNRGGIDGPDTFAQWYKDIWGTNLS